MMQVVNLSPIDRSGSVTPPPPLIPEVMQRHCAATADFYNLVGFHPPWIGCVSIGDGQPVGGGAFKGPPYENRVEIAYYTLADLERH